MEGTVSQGFPAHLSLCALQGVLQVEALAQLGGICMLDPEAEATTQFFFGGVEKCRWRKPVVPGDCLVRPKNYRRILMIVFHRAIPNMCSTEGLTPSLP